MAESLSQPSLKSRNRKCAKEILFSINAVRTHPFKSWPRKSLLTLKDFNSAKLISYPGSLYVDLVTNEFERLKSKYYHPPRLGMPDETNINQAPSDISTDRKVPEGLANELQFILLPRLLEQICTLSSTLELPALLNEPESNLSLVLQLQADLECSLDRIQYLGATLWSITRSLRNRTNDHHLKGLKSFRLSRVKQSLPIMADDMYHLFDVANQLIQQTELSSVPCMAVCDSYSLEERLHWAVYFPWQLTRNIIERNMEFIIHRLNYPTYATKGENQLQRPVEFGDDTVIQLNKLMLPIMKLCVIFLGKFSSRGLAKERLPIFMEICSDQIEILGASADPMIPGLRRLLRKLRTADGPGGGVTSDDLTSLAKSLKSCLESPLPLIHMYFIPLIPDLNVQKHYTHWCETWNNLIALAIHNFTRVAESFVAIP
ncbi:hypothetical protein, variant [Puccinia triticina 1-1 BBBD Race 1]|uniref:Uncharacterized protein n=1 Tax=Puccinia triticina (isolate 1-1 / race 1 (BBBD)) TaxID=630390 RepID=A0A180GE14_PUCT1|nr:hypothetical protein, variant [Puccinia triticina 1-1 BBBD Race 1]